METMFFLLFILFTVVVLFYVINRVAGTESNSSGQKLRRPAPVERRPGSSGPIPGNNVLAHNDEVWIARRNHLKNPNPLDGQTAYYARAEDEPGYDGYSRRDRHHLTPAHIKDEVEYDYLHMPSVKFQSTEKPKPGEKILRKA